MLSCSLPFVASFGFPWCPVRQRINQSVLISSCDPTGTSPLEIADGLKYGSDNCCFAELLCSRSITQVSISIEQRLVAKLMNNPRNAFGDVHRHIPFEIQCLTSGRCDYFQPVNRVVTQSLSFMFCQAVN